MFIRKTQYDDFWPKIYLILYPILGNLTTHIAVLKSEFQNIAPHLILFRNFT